MKITRTLVALILAINLMIAVISGWPPICKVLVIANALALLALVVLQLIYWKE